MDKEKTDKPDITIIIPCFNQGHYLREALSTVFPLSDKLNIEVFIVNDGSTDANTLAIIKEIENEAIVSVINQSNKGLANARNTGIRLGKADFFLPLDSDNKITTEYVVEGLKMLKSDSRIAAVYSDFFVFGEKNYCRTIPDFPVYDLFYKNYIDACALVRKSSWLEVGGYDENMPYMGYEDWDLWLSFLGKGLSLHHIKEPLFHYRISNDSMLQKIKNQQKHKDSLEYIRRKHFLFFSEQFEALFLENQKLKKDFDILKRSFRKQIKLLKTNMMNRFPLWIKK